MRGVNSKFSGFLQFSPSQELLDRALLELDLLPDLLLELDFAFELDWPLLEEDFGTTLDELDLGELELDFALEDEFGLELELEEAGLTIKFARITVSAVAWKIATGFSLYESFIQ